MKHKHTPSAKTLEKQARRAQKEIDLGAKTRALPDQHFNVILSDPPWRFEVYNRVTGLDRDASNHYPVMTLDDIKALPVASLAAPNAVLFLWATAPMMPQALEVMAAWGFAYKSQAVWIKDRVGLGFWFRGKHEPLLIGTRGHVPAPAPGTQFPSVIEAKVREHSRKPDEIYEIIERYFPTVPRLELFARPETARPGWSYWGPDARPEFIDLARARALEAWRIDHVPDAREAARLRKLAFDPPAPDAQPRTAAVLEFPSRAGSGIAGEYGFGEE